jgi:hypothetical protein
VTGTLTAAAAAGATRTEPSFRRSRAVAAAWLAGAFCLSLPFTVQSFRYGDEWWHIALGRLILRSGIPAAEPFSFVATQHPWVEQQWLYEVALAALVRLGGDGLASLVLGVVGGLAMLLAALAVPRASRVPRGWCAAAMLFGTVMAGMALGVRGETVSALGFAATLLILRRWRDGSRRAVWLLPPLFLLWANLHAGFVAGLGLLALTLVIHQPARRGWTVAASHPARAYALVAVGAAAAAVLGGLVVGAAALSVLWGVLLPVPVEPGVRRSPLLWASLAAAAATLVNPAGPGLYAYVAETLGNPLLSQFVSEWQSPDFHDTLTRLIAVAAAMLPLCWLLARRVRVPDALLAAVLLLATLQAVRNVSLLAVVVIPQLAEYGAAAWALRAPTALRRRLRLRPPAALAVAGSVAVCAAALAVVVPRLTPPAAAAWEQASEPAAAATYVAERFPGQRLLSSDTDAGYLAYRFPSGRVVFVYDEIGIFGTGPETAYREIAVLAPGWQDVLRRYQLRHAILAADSADTSALLELGWTVSCYDRASGRVVMSAGGAPPLATPPSPTSAPAC